MSFHLQQRFPFCNLDLRNESCTAQTFPKLQLSSSRQGKTMLDDLNIPIGAIRPCGKSLKEQILDIQRFRSRRDEAHVWAAKLRFLKVGSNGGIPAVGDTSSPNISEDSASKETVDQGRASLGSIDGENDSSADSVSKSSTEEPCLCDLIPSFQKGYEYPSLELTSADLLAGCRHYVAVSYCWSTSEERQAETGKTYTIETAQGPRANKAPSSILDRAIAYAAEYGLGLIWIDQECINQDDRDDKENGIQSMDLVYERATHPVGLLKHHIDSQAHLDVMELLAQGAPCGLEHFDAMIEVLEILRDDRWFSRTWCLQEATSAGGDMALLLPCDRHLLKIQDTGLGNSEDAIEFSILHCKRQLLGLWSASRTIFMKWMRRWRRGGGRLRNTSMSCTLIRLLPAVCLAMQLRLYSIWLGAETAGLLIG